MDTKLIVASDHAGFALKEEVRAELLRQGRSVEDCGAFSAQPANWAEYGALAAARVAADPERSVGILVCGSGIGMSIVANRFPGVRAALCHSEDAARLARLHNNANCLALGARVVDAATALRIVAVFLATPFEGGRHQARLDFLRDHVEKKIVPSQN
ncbi:MAG: ribose 5-phosphate isomerase B [Acidobacteria bacterium]|nr:ribose 5-phosphate isomerase B [Acidobacteriota bacterium]